MTQLRLRNGHVDSKMSQQCAVQVPEKMPAQPWDLDRIAGRIDHSAEQIAVGKRLPMSSRKYEIFCIGNPGIRRLLSFDGGVAL